MNTQLHFVLQDNDVTGASIVGVFEQGNQQVLIDASLMQKLLDAEEISKTLVSWQENQDGSINVVFAIA